MLGSNNKAVCIVGGGFVNKGAEAMALTVAHAIRKSLPDVDIYMQIESRDFQQARDNGLLPVKGDRPTSGVSWLASKIRTAKTLYKCSAIIDVGGYQFGDPWGKKATWRKTRYIKRCAKFENLIFFMPQAWGPFSSPGIRDAIQSVVDTATLCYVRDKTSMAALEDVVGKDCPKIRFAHDIAWNFQGADLPIGQQLIRDTELPENNKSITICLTPNMKIYERCSGVGQGNEYIRFFGQIIEHICSEHNARVVLMGHKLRPDNSENKDDRTLCNYLLSSLEKSMPVAHIDRILTAAEVKSVIGNCDLLISSRYHALIAALSQGIPVASIGWSHKYDELLAEVGLSSNIISLSKTSKKACVDIDSIVERLPEISAAIKAKVPTFKKSGEDAINEVLSRIKERFES